MIKNNITIIGGGIAGMEAAGKLAAAGFEVSLLEKGNRLGGHVDNWYQLFPDKKPSKDVISQLKSAIHDCVDIHFGAEVHKVNRSGNTLSINLTDGQDIETNAIIVTTGFDLFNAAKKEEYGYGIYEDVITSADLEEKFNSGKPVKTSKDQTPKKIAFIHCVGSRDEKAGNKYCSKVCCVTAIKQAIELKEMIPDAEIFCFYMDLRLFDRYFEDLYHEAQVKHGINFIRGRLSECCEDINGNIVVKAEDTLSGKPLKMTMDIVVLMVGKVASKGSMEIASKLSLPVDNDNFFKQGGLHMQFNNSGKDGIFLAGTCTGPKTITETIADARSAALQAAAYVKKIKN